MDMQTRPATQIAMDQVVSILHSSPTALSPSEIADQCSTDAQAVYRAIGNLLRDRRIECTGETKGRRGQPTRLYQIVKQDEPRAGMSDADLLREHLEREMAGSAIGEAHDGDEHERAVYVAPPEIPARLDRDDWFIARRIADLDDPEPRLAEARQWAAIVGAIADRLDAGRALPPDADVIAALRDMRQGLLEVAA